MKEADIDAAVGRWLASRGLVPHYQVEMPGGRIDVVGFRHGLAVAVESKTRQCLALVQQACRWLPFADEVWMAVGADGITPTLPDIARALGAGVLSVHTSPETVVKVVKPAHVPGNRETLAAALAPEQTETEPGAGAGYSTAWKRWAERFRSVVEDCGPLLLKDAIRESKPHWGQTAYGRLRTVQSKLLADRRDPDFVGVVQEGKGAKAIVRWVTAKQETDR